MYFFLFLRHFKLRKGAVCIVLDTQRRFVLIQWKALTGRFAWTRTQVCALEMCARCRHITWFKRIHRSKMKAKVAAPESMCACCVSTRSCACVHTRQSIPPLETDWQTHTVSRRRRTRLSPPHQHTTTTTTPSSTLRPADRRTVVRLKTRCADRQSLRGGFRWDTSFIFLSNPRDKCPSFSHLNWTRRPWALLLCVAVSHVVSCRVVDKRLKTFFFLILFF